LAPRHLRFEVNERILVDDSVVMPLEDADVEMVIEKLATEQVEAVGVCTPRRWRITPARSRCRDGRMPSRRKARTGSAKPLPTRDSDVHLEQPVELLR
jgi:hypothetical protein